MKYLEFILIVFIGCNGQPKESEAIVGYQKDHIANDSTNSDFKISETIEFIDVDSVILNDKILFKTKTSSLYKLLGKPDSIVHPSKEDICISYYDKKFVYAFYNNSCFEVYEDTSVLRRIDLKNGNWKLVSGSYLFNSFTTLSELRNYFPMAVKSAESEKSNADGSLCIQLPTSKNEKTVLWYLFIVNEKLDRIEYWMPC